MKNELTADLINTSQMINWFKTKNPWELDEIIRTMSTEHWKTNEEEIEKYVKYNKRSFGIIFTNKTFPDIHLIIEVVLIDEQDKVYNIVNWLYCTEESLDRFI